MAHATIRPAPKEVPREQGHATDGLVLCLMATGNQKSRRFVPTDCSVTRRQRTLARYGMTEADYARVLKRQGGGCGICGRKPKTRQLAVDHDHSKKGREAVRGILCMRCNRYHVSKNNLKSARAVEEYLWLFVYHGNAIDRGQP